MWHSIVLRDPDGTVVGTLSSGEDVTDRRRAEIELRRAKEEAELASRSKSEFLANMSHEIRTPMTAILGFADELLEESWDHRAHEQLATIKRNGEHLLRVINDVLDLSKIEAGKLEIERVPCSPIEVVGDVQSLMQARAQAKGIEFHVGFQTAVPAVVHTDPTRLRQILLNLLGNAIKFTDQGAVRLACSYRVDRPAGALLQFDVSDTGIGICPEHLTRLFHPFTQADASVSRNFGGTGLGLTIVRRLAAMLGGDVSVESEPGRGSRFQVTVSAGVGGDVPMIEDPMTALALAVEPEATAPRDANRRTLDCRILLAEDGADNRRLISRLLEKAGATVGRCREWSTRGARGSARDAASMHQRRRRSMRPDSHGHANARDGRLHGHAPACGVAVIVARSSPSPPTRWPRTAHVAWLAAATTTSPSRSTATNSWRPSTVI